jgi:hypothetical protein
MNETWRDRWPVWRHRWLLTAAEKRVLVFVIGAFALGLAADHYRAKHPPASPPAPMVAKKRPPAQSRQP